MTKFLFDNILLQPWSEWDEDKFMGVANFEDIYEFVDNGAAPPSSPLPPPHSV